MQSENIYLESSQQQLDLRAEQGVWFSLWGRILSSCPGANTWDGLDR